MANAEIVLFQWTDAQDVQLQQYKGKFSDNLSKHYPNKDLRLETELQLFSILQFGK